MTSHCRFPDCVSASIIKKFLDSPLGWFNDTFGEPEPESVAMYSGTLLHNRVGRYYGLDIQDETPSHFSPDDLEAAILKSNAFYAQWSTAITERGVRPAKFMGKLAVEQEFSIFVPGIDIPLVGKVDFASDQYLLCDWKTTEQKPDGWKKYNRNACQQYCYSLWWLSEVDPSAVVVPFYYVLIGPEGVNWLNYSVNVDEIAEWIERTLKPVVKMMKGALSG